MHANQNPAYQELLRALRTQLRGELLQLENLMWDHIVRLPLRKGGSSTALCGRFGRSVAARELRELLTELIRCKEQAICEVERLLEDVEALEVASYQ